MFQTKNKILFFIWHECVDRREFFSFHMFILVINGSICKHELSLFHFHVNSFCCLLGKFIVDLVIKEKKRIENMNKCNKTSSLNTFALFVKISI